MSLYMSDNLSEFERKVLACCSHVDPRGEGARTEEYNGARAALRAEDECGLRFLRAAKNLQKAALIDVLWDITTKGREELAKGSCNAV